MRIRATINPALWPRLHAEMDRRGQTQPGRTVSEILDWYLPKVGEESVDPDKPEAFARGSAVSTMANPDPGVDP